jgi:hypothetical protein
LNTITIVITPRTSGKYDVHLKPNGLPLRTNCKEPFLEAARKLLLDGTARPEDRLEMKRGEGQPVALSGGIGKAAKLMVRESATAGPSFVRYLANEQDCPSLEWLFPVQRSAKNGRFAFARPELALNIILAVLEPHFGKENAPFC